MANSRRYWIGMNHVKGIGAVRFRTLMDHFGDVETAWKASLKDLIQAGLTAKIAEELVKVRSEIDLEGIEAGLRAQHIQVLTW